MIIKDYQLFHKIVPSQGKLMGIDIGTKRIGIATTDELRMLSTPKAIIDRKGDSRDFLLIKQIIDENSVKAIVAGFPINMNGGLNEMSHFSKRFIINLDKFLGENLPIFPADERLTSFEAKEFAREIPNRKNQKSHDDIAASIILRDFVDLVR